MGWVDALGWFGSALLVFSLLQARMLRLRVLNTVACLILVVFNALLEVWPMVAMNIVLAGINLWFIARMLRERGDERAYAVLPVAEDDAYLRHFLDVHRADIAKFFPAFSGRRGRRVDLPRPARRRDGRRHRGPRRRGAARRRSSSTTSPRGSATSRRASSSSAAAACSPTRGSGGSRPRPAWWPRTTTASASPGPATPGPWSSARPEGLGARRVDGVRRTVRRGRGSP